MTRRWSPSADATLALGSELLALDAAAVLGARSARRVSRQIPATPPHARLVTILAVRRFLRNLGIAIPMVITGSGQW